MVYPSQLRFQSQRNWSIFKDLKLQPCKPKKQKAHVVRWNHRGTYEPHTVACQTDPRNVVSELRRAAVDFFHLPVQEKEKTNAGGTELGMI